MRIGLVVSAYDCEKYIEAALQPWLELRADSEHEFVIAASNGQWLKFVEAGVEPTLDRTGQILLDSDLDFMYKTSGKRAVSEEESRTILLRYLQYNDCDLIWTLDGDEVYKKDEILRTIDYVQSHPEVDCFRINFKNFTLRLPLFSDDFVRATIYRSKIRGGISKFYFDTDAVYEDGGVPDTITSGVIPRHIAFPDHFTWLKENKRSFEKIVHQRYKYGENQCAFKIEGDTLKFDDNFWSSRGIQLPCLKESGLVYSYDFQLKFDRKQNLFEVFKVSRQMNAGIKVLDMNRVLLYQTNMELEPNYGYWFMPNSSRNFNDEDNFKGFMIQIFENSVLIHEEIFHLRA
jgi:hypothetical protein